MSSDIVVRKVIDINDEVIDEYSFTLEEKEEVIYDPIYLYEIKDMVYGVFVNYILDNKHLNIIFCSFSKEHGSDFDVSFDVCEREVEYLKRVLKSDEVKKRIKDLEKVVLRLSYDIREFNEDIEKFSVDKNYSQEKINKLYKHFRELRDDFSNLSLLETKILSNWGVDYTTLVERVDNVLDKIGNKKFTLEKRGEALPYYDDKNKELDKDIYDELGIPRDYQTIKPKFLVKSFVDEVNGGLSSYKLELLINYYYENGWKLYKVFTNTLGIDKSMNGFHFPNESIEQTVVIFERIDEE